MKIKIAVLIALLALSLFGCEGKVGNSNVAFTEPRPNAASPTPVPTSSRPKNGDYDGKGVVTKLNLEQGSIEIDHEEIKDVMPAMRMEFFVSDKKMLDGLKVGDKIDFVLRYQDPTETLVSIKRAQ